MVKKIAVFCGAYSGNDKRFTEACRSLATILVQNQMELVYGGGNIGLMGTIANEMLALDGNVVGVIPKNLAELELMHEDATEMHVVDSMQERKDLIISMSDAFILLPGGIGSLDEFFEVFTLNKLGIHQKPFGILNVGGFYDLLIQLLQHTVDQGFLHAEHHQMVMVDNDPARLVSRLAMPPAAIAPLSVHVAHCERVT